MRRGGKPVDAAYVSMAEMFHATLLTSDARMAKAPGPRCAFQVLQ